eukprot:126834-Rhodomonas_salina.4
MPTSRSRTATPIPGLRSTTVTLTAQARDRTPVPAAADRAVVGRGSTLIRRHGSESDSHSLNPGLETWIPKFEGASEIELG